MQGLVAFWVALNSTLLSGKQDYTPWPGILSLPIPAGTAGAKLRRTPYLEVYGLWVVIGGVISRVTILITQ